MGDGAIRPVLQPAFAKVGVTQKPIVVAETAVSGSTVTITSFKDNERAAGKAFCRNLLAVVTNGNSKVRDLADQIINRGGSLQKKRLRSVF